MDAALKTQAEKLARELAASAGTIDDLNALMRGMMKAALERMLDAEMRHHLDAARTAIEPTTPVKPNRRNGHSPKTVHGDLGPIPPDAPRDRDGTFEPQLIPEHQRRLAGSDDKTLALYAKGMTTRDIPEVVRELYGGDVSATLVSQTAAGPDAEATAWRTRRLDPVRPIVSLDGVAVPVRGESGRVSRHAMPVAVGGNVRGKKELLVLWLGESGGRSSGWRA